MNTGYLRMSGLNDGIYYLSWFLYFLCIYTISMVPMMLLGASEFLRLFDDTDVTLLLFVWFSHGEYSQSIRFVMVIIKSHTHFIKENSRMDQFYFSL